MPWLVVNAFKFGESMNRAYEGREPLHLNRPDYDLIRASLEDAVSETLRMDWDLVALGCHEQAIAHRIAIYLERAFPTYHTDCEYNRRKHHVKDYPAESGRVRKKMRPDIIVHRRNGEMNVLAVEMKANANKSSSCDPQKLQALYSDADYLYKGTAFVRIFNSIQDIRDGQLRALIQWFDVRHGNLYERAAERTPIEYVEKLNEVIAIHQARLEAARQKRIKSRRKRKL
jgi:hypothetical protein